MKPLLDQIQSGIHTYSLFMVLTAKEYYTILHCCHSAYNLQDDYWSQNRTKHIDIFADRGIKLYLSRRKQIYTLKIRIEPCRVLGSTDATRLYQPDAKSYRSLVKNADKLLKTIAVPCSIDDMSICRMDATADLYFHSAPHVLYYLRTLQKGRGILHYKRDFFKEGSKKAKNPREANRHSYRIKCRRAAFFCYDKCAQLEMTDRLTDAQLNKHILRLEAELQRKAFIQQLGCQPDNFHYLRASSRQAVPLILRYLKRVLKHMTGTHLRYEDAFAWIQAQSWRQKTKKRAAYLLRKVSDCHTIDTAIDKTCEKFGIDHRSMRQLLKKMEKAGINPITLPNSAGTKALPALSKVLP